MFPFLVHHFLKCFPSSSTFFWNVFLPHQGPDSFKTTFYWNVSLPRPPFPKMFPFLIKGQNLLRPLFFFSEIFSFVRISIQMSWQCSGKSSRRRGSMVPGNGLLSLCSMAFKCHTCACHFCHYFYDHAQRHGNVMECYGFCKVQIWPCVNLSSELFDYVCILGGWNEQKSSKVMFLECE